MPAGRDIAALEERAAALKSACGRMAEDIARATEAAFKSGIGAIGKLVTTLEESIGAMPKRPGKIEMEFGATLSADCKLWIVSGKGDYAFKVKLSWERNSSAAAS
jgi:hypothetical protein